MQINAKQDMFYSVTIAADSQEYVELPVPPGAMGIQLIATEDIDGFTGTGDDPESALGSGWAQIFETFRLEDNSRADSKVIDLAYTAALGQNDMAHIEEMALLAAPLPGQQSHVVSQRHLNLWTGPLGQARLFAKTRSSLATVFENSSATSITIHFVALMGPAIPQQSWKIYHIGESTDTNIEFTFPTGALLRTTVVADTPRVLNDIYMDGRHLTSNPETMLLDFNILRNSEDVNDWVYNRYFWSENLAGKRVRFEKSTAGTLEFLCVYAGA